MKRIVTNAAGVAFLTILSQILGYIREMLFAYYQGTSAELEAFQVAETVPLLFTQILISAVPLALTPLLVREQGKGKNELIHNAIIFCGIVLIGICIIIWIFPNVFVRLVAPGYQGNKYIMTCRLVTIMVPNIFFLSMVAIWNAFLNSKKQFLIPTAIALLLNLSVVLMQIITKGNVFYVALGSVCGGILMFFLSLLCCVRKYNFHLKVSNINRRGIRTIVISILPVCVISSFTSLNLMLDKFFASSLGDGAVATLSYSYKIINLPVYLFVTSITKVMLPDITLLIAEKKAAELSVVIKKIVIFCLIGGVIAIIALQFLGNWLVAILFGRGAFNAQDVIRTASSLKIFAFGITGMALSSFFQSISYAGGRYYEPLRILVIQLLVYIMMVIAGMKYIGLDAVILGNVIAVNISIIIWLFILKKNYDVRIIKRT